MFHNWLSNAGGRALLAAGLLLVVNGALEAQSNTAARRARAERASELTAAVQATADLAAATERRDLLLAMFRDDPASALRAALPGAVRNGLPAEVQALVEEHVEIDGAAEVRYEDGDRSSRLRRFVHGDAEVLEVHFATEPDGFATGARVHIRGVRLDGELAADGGAGTIQQVATALPYTFGEQRVLMILVNFQDRPTLQPYSAATASNALFGTVSNFDRENSQDQTWLTGDVAGWFTIPVNSTVCDTMGILTYAQQAAQAAGFNLALYGRFVYAFPSTSACSWSGSGQVGGSVTHTWINGSLTTRVLAHELGHNFGVYHSRALECGTTTLGSSCTAVEYGDPADVMGVSGVVAHFNAFQKERMGWLNYQASLPILTVDGDGTFLIEPYAAAGTGPKALKILKSVDPTTGKRTHYYVEYRLGSGFDSGLAGNSTLANGVVIHTGSESTGNSSYVLDMTPETASWSDAALAVGRSFTDPAAGVTITPLSAGSGGATVQVQLGSLACVTSAPGIAVSSGQMQVTAAGAPVTFPLSITNLSGAGCAASTISLRAAAPAGWTAVLSPSSLTLSPGASAPATLTVTPPIGSSGANGVGIDAVDTGSALVGSTTASVTVASTLTVAASVSVSSGKGSKSLSIRSVVQAGAMPVAAASVSSTVRLPSGGTTTLSGTTAADGTVTLKYSLKPKDPAGLYQVQVVASKGGVTGSTTTTVTVP
jgi:hypothetical protein